MQWHVPLDDKFTADNKYPIGSLVCYNFKLELLDAWQTCWELNLIFFSNLLLWPDVVSIPRTNQNFYLLYDKTSYLGICHMV
jgi:hypothetical protein